MYNPIPPGSDKPDQSQTTASEPNHKPAPDENAADYGITAKAPRDRRLVGPRSAAVTAVAVVNFVFGAFEFLNGVSLLAGARFMGSMPGASAEFQQAAGNVSDLARGLAFLALLTGMVMGIAGLGVTARRPWGRDLTLVLGGLAALVALTSLSPLNPLSFILHAGYAALVFTVLLNPRLAPEFYPESARAAAMRSGATPERRNFLIWLTPLLCLGAFFLGLLLGWSLYREAPASTLASGTPLALVMAADDKSNAAAAAVAAQLVHTQNLRVIDPELVRKNQKESIADIQQRARELGALLLVIVTEDGQSVQARVVEAKTGVLLGTNEWRKGNPINVHDLIQNALQRALRDRK